MRRFIWTILKFSIVPFVVGCLFLLGYWYFDPFKVLRTYADFSKPVIVPNRDYVSTETFIRNNPHYHYNSFIFGSSRTMAFKPARWKKYLTQDAEPFLLMLQMSLSTGFIPKSNGWISKVFHLKMSYSLFVTTVLLHIVAM
jgi:hypothetical protein